MKNRKYQNIDSKKFTKSPKNILHKTIPKSILHKNIITAKKNIASIHKLKKPNQKIEENLHTIPTLRVIYNTCNNDTTDHQEIRTYGDSLATYQLFRYI